MKKYLVDTCGWVEWIVNGELASTFEPFLKHLTHLIVPTLIQFELYKWVCREKNEATALEVIGMTERSTVITLDTYLALTAADLSKQYNLSMADSIIYATAKNNNAELITSDQHFSHLAGVKYFKKSKI